MLGVKLRRHVQGKCPTWTSASELSLVLYVSESDEVTSRFLDISAKRTNYTEHRYEETTLLILKTLHFLFNATKRDTLLSETQKERREK